MNEAQIKEIEEAAESIILVSSEEAINLVDTALLEYAGRHLIASSEITDLLLDIRQHLVLVTVEF